jgi:hypothetical protein
MKNLSRLILVSLMMILAAPAYSAQVAQVYTCEQDDDATEQDLRESASEWLKAAKTVKGGENLEVTLYFPIAVAGTGETDFLYVINAPSIAEWGMFWDGYAGSAASEVDQGSDDNAICPDSALWESVTIE